MILTISDFCLLIRVLHPKICLFVLLSYMHKRTTMLYLTSTKNVFSLLLPYFSDFKATVHHPVSYKAMRIKWRLSSELYLDHLKNHTCLKWTVMNLMHAVYKMTLCIFITQKIFLIFQVLHTSSSSLSSFFLFRVHTKCISKRLSDCFRLGLSFSIFRNNIVNSYCVYNTKNLKVKMGVIVFNPPSTSYCYLVSTPSGPTSSFQNNLPPSHQLSSHRYRSLPLLRRFHHLLPPGPSLHCLHHLSDRLPSLPSPST